MVVGLLPIKWGPKEVLEAGNPGRDNTVGCNYLSLPAIPASGTQVFELSLQRNKHILHWNQELPWCQLCHHWWHGRLSWMTTSSATSDDKVGIIMTQLWVLQYVPRILHRVCTLLWLGCNHIFFPNPSRLISWLTLLGQSWHYRVGSILGATLRDKGK